MSISPGNITPNVEQPIAQQLGALQEIVARMASMVEQKLQNIEQQQASTTQLLENLNKIHEETRSIILQSLRR